MSGDLGSAPVPRPERRTPSGDRPPIQPKPSLHPTGSPLLPNGRPLGKTSSGMDQLPLVFDEKQASGLYEAKTLCRDSFRILYEFYQNKTLCDVEIVVGSKSLRCHRIVLACVSQYFRSMFTSQMAESHKESITIQDIDEDSLEQLIKFAYTSRIKFTTDNVQSLLYASSILQIESVANACGEFMKTHMHPSNCIGIRTFAEQHGRTDLIAKADQFMLDHFLEVVECDEFLGMNAARIEWLVSSSDINIRRETEVYEAVMRWVKHDREQRQEYLSTLVSKVRLGLLPTTYLMEKVCPDELVRSNLECRDRLDEAKFYQLSKAQVVPGMQVSESVHPRKSTAGVIFCVGGRGGSGDPFKSIEVYDFRKDQWLQVTEMSTKRRHVGIVSVSGKLYAVGGHDGNKHLSSGEVFHPEKNKWNSLACMATPRRGIGLASLGGPIYAIGGLDDTTCFNTVERYDIDSDTWSHVQNMNIARGGVAVTTAKGYIYAIGGNDGTASLESGERYDPHLNKWTLIAPMSKRRAGAGVAELNGKLYMIGGFDDNAPLDSVECYDPEKNTWKLVNHMTCARGGVGVATLAGKLYAVGGHDGNQYLSSVEAYDTVHDSWSSVAGISSNRAGAGIATVACHLEMLRDTATKQSLSVVGMKRWSTGTRMCCTVQCSIVAQTSYLPPINTMASDRHS